MRQSEAFDRNRQTLTRTALIFSLSQEFRIGIGYAYVDATDYDLGLEPTNSENRIFEQFEYKQTLDQVGLTHRFRLEQRFVEQQGRSHSWHRIRYRLAGRYPKATEPGVYASVYNEFFVDYARGTWATYAQNRFYTALGVPLGEMRKLRTELGYLWQSIRREPRDSLHVHAMQVSLFWEL